MITAKLLLGIGLAGSLALTGTAAYAKYLHGQLSSVKEAKQHTELQVGILTSQLTQARQREKLLAQAVQAQAARAEAQKSRVQAEQEKINALTTTCTLSAESHSLLWEIYETRSGVQTH